MSPKIHADLFARFVESQYLPDEIECGKAHPSEDGEALHIPSCLNYAGSQFNENEKLLA